MPIKWSFFVEKNKVNKHTMEKYSCLMNTFGWNKELEEISGGQLTMVIKMDGSD